VSILSKLFSSSDTVSKTVDAVISTGDALFFTDEEKSIANQKKLDWILKYHEASKGSNIARRLLAVMLTGVFLLLVIVVAGLYVIGWQAEADKVYTLIKDTLVTPVGIIVVFYYSVAAISNFRQK